MSALAAMFDRYFPMGYLCTSKEKLQDYSPEAFSFYRRYLRMGPLKWSVLTLKMSLYDSR